MHFIALNRLIAVALMLACASAIAGALQPRTVREPVLGLRYETARVKFDSLPAEAIANCETLADDENRTSVWFIYGHTSDASGRAYYVTGGYDIRKNAPSHKRFETEDMGLIVLIDRGKCTPLDAVRETFDARMFDDEMSQSVLKQLAVDVVRRLERAFGGRARLATELRNQHVDMESLPPELKEAMQDYLSR